MFNALKLKGRVRVWCGDSLVCDSSNRVVKSGLELFARLVMSEAEAVLPNLFKLGDSAALTTSDMTGIQGSLVASLPAAVERRNNVLSWTGSFTYNEIYSRDVREIGLFNSEVPEVMMARFLPIQQFTLRAGTPVKISWEIIVGE